MSWGRRPVPAFAAERRCAKSTARASQAGTQQPCALTHRRCRGQTFCSGVRTPSFRRFSRSGSLMAGSPQAMRPRSSLVGGPLRLAAIDTGKPHGHRARSAVNASLALFHFGADTRLSSPDERASPCAARPPHRPRLARAGRRHRRDRCRAPTRTGRRRGSACGYDSNPPRSSPGRTAARSTGRSAVFRAQEACR